MPTWMLVEDEPDFYELVLAIFEVIGVEALAFTNGEEAVSWIEDVDAGPFQGELPELALFDIRLPGTSSGADVSARIRESPVLCNMAIVLCTAYKYSSEQQQQQMKYAGADLFLFKPIPRPQEFITMMNDVLKKRNSS